MTQDSNPSTGPIEDVQADMQQAIRQTALLSDSQEREEDRRDRRVTGHLTGNLTGGLTGRLLEPLTDDERAEQQELYRLLPPIVVSALWKGGYRSVGQIAETPDIELLYCRNIGTDRLQQVRAAIPYITPEGELVEQQDPEQRIRELEARIAELEATIKKLTG